MTMKLHRARDMGDQYFLQVWLDDTKEALDKDGRPIPGEPDPEGLREWRWAKDMDLVDIRRETRLLALLELDKMAPTVITLPEEGSTL